MIWYKWYDEKYLRYVIVVRSLLEDLELTLDMSDIMQIKPLQEDIIRTLINNNNNKCKIEVYALNMN